MKKNLINIFVGTDIEANYIASILTENNINHIIHNTLEGSMSAGWAFGSSYSSTIIRIDSEDYEKAKRIIDEYLNQ